MTNVHIYNIIDLYIKLQWIHSCSQSMAYQCVNRKRLVELMNVVTAWRKIR